MMAQVGVLGACVGIMKGDIATVISWKGSLELRQHIKGRNGIAVWVGLANVFPNFGHIYYDEMLPNYGDRLSVGEFKEKGLKYVLIWALPKTARISPLISMRLFAKN